MSPKGNDSVDSSRGPGRARVASRTIGPGDPAGLVIREALERGLDRIRANEPGVRQGDVEGVHRLRTTTRRLRSELRLFRGLVDDGWAEGLEAELKWLARGLGDVRDLDVLQVRLQATSGELSDALAALFATLQGRRDAAGRALLDMLRRRAVSAGSRTSCPRPWTGPIRS